MVGSLIACYVIVLTLRLSWCVACCN